MTQLYSSSMPEILTPPPPPDEYYLVLGRDGTTHAFNRTDLEQAIRQGRVSAYHQVFSSRTKEWIYVDELPWFQQNGPQRVVVTDIKMPFMSMLVFMIKWSLAAIPAVIIVAVILSVIMGALLAGGR